MIIQQIWILLCGTLVFFMQAGFTCYEAGFVQSKNVISVSIENLLTFMTPNPQYGATIPFITYFSYQEMFAIITPALITGAFADRVNFKSYLVFLVFWSFLIYVPLAHWVWGGGFLQQLGVVDFAGGIVVHASAGMVILDEITIALYFGVLNEADVLSLVHARPENTELIFTGRYAPQSLIDEADLVTEMTEVKHYYAAGVEARDGIER